MEKTSKALRRGRTRRLVRRLTVGLGLALAISPTHAGARERASSPRRATGTPPWIEPSGLTPPSRIGSTGAFHPPGKKHAVAHPAIHGKRAGKVVPLFPSETRRETRSGRHQRGTERRASMQRHPAGKGNSAKETVTVKPGDSLWTIAERRVGHNRTYECWPSLYRVNRNIIGPDPDHIEPGQILEIPGECR